MMQVQPTEFFQPYPLTSTLTTSGRTVKSVIKKDKNDNIISITNFDSSGRVTYYKGTEPEFGDKFEYEYQYDNMGRETYYHDILTGYKFWKTYDHDGNLIMEIDSNGVHEKYDIEYYPIGIYGAWSTTDSEVKYSLTGPLVPVAFNGGEPTQGSFDF
jgi:hypothetical protein